MKDKGESFLIFGQLFLFLYVRKKKKKGFHSIYYKGTMPRYITEKTCFFGGDFFTVTTKLDPITSLWLSLFGSILKLCSAPAHVNLLRQFCLLFRILVEVSVHTGGLILGRGFVPVPSSFEVKSLGLGVRELKIQSLGFGV